MILAIIGAGFLVFGLLLVLPYIGSLAGAAYGYAPVTELGGLGVFLILIGALSAILSIAIGNTTKAPASDEYDSFPPPVVSAGPLGNCISSLESRQWRKRCD